MNVALVTISDRGDLYYPRCWESLKKHLRCLPDLHIHVDDQQHQKGLAGSVQWAWSQVPPEIDYVLHWEEDFLAVAPVEIEAMAKALTRNPHCAQMVLKRQADPRTPEATVGGFIEQHPDEYIDNGEWIEHRRLFSLNPCLIPARIIAMGWPASNEAGMTQLLLDRSYCFGIWGKKSDPPRVEHIGWTRGEGWKP